MNTKDIGLNFKSLVSSIQQIHGELKQQALHSVNTLLTLRNWLIGYYIAEYELKGLDRADYGDKLFERLEEELKRIRVTRSNKRDLYRLRLFYNTYPQIMGSLTPQLQKLIGQNISSFSSVNSMLINPSPQIMESVTPQSETAVRELITKLSFTHIEILNRADNKEG